MCFFKRVSFAGQHVAVVLRFHACFQIDEPNFAAECHLLRDDVGDDATFAAVRLSDDGKMCRSRDCDCPLRIGDIKTERISV